MGYEFQGFFVEHEDQLFRAIQSRWPREHVREFSEPFHGIGLKERSRADVEFCDSDYEQIPITEDELPSFSKQFPESTFVYIDARCHGGICFYDGFACKNGEIVQQCSDSEDSLGTLLAHFDIREGPRPFFQPFQSGFFGEKD